MQLELTRMIHVGCGVNCLHNDGLSSWKYFNIRFPQWMKISCYLLSNFLLSSSTILPSRNSWKYYLKYLYQFQHPKIWWYFWPKVANRDDNYETSQKIMQWVSINEFLQSSDRMLMMINMANGWQWTVMIIQAASKKWSMSSTDPSECTTPTLSTHSPFTIHNQQATQPLITPHCN